MVSRRIELSHRGSSSAWRCRRGQTRSTGFAPEVWEKHFALTREQCDDELAEVCQGRFIPASGDGGAARPRGPAMWFLLNVV